MADPVKITRDMMRPFLGDLFVPSWATPISMDRKAETIEVRIKTNHKGFFVIPSMPFVTHS
jgi:hypothetical protein